MTHWGLYRWAVRCLPRQGKVTASDFSGEETAAVQHLLLAHRCLGAVVLSGREQGSFQALAFGKARMDGAPVQRDTVFRAASISKFVTALGAMKLKEQGKIDLDMDVNACLPFPVRHPQAPDTPITLRMLFTHTAGLRDGEAYNAGIARGEGASALLRQDSFAGHLPGEKWEYSNFGAGLAGAAMEAAIKMDFEELMQETVFKPLGVTATYYPQRVKGELADAIRILPRSKTPNFNARERRQRPNPKAEVNPEQHYNLAHGALCVNAEALYRLGLAGLKPGFLSGESLNEMRKIAAPFGERASNLSQGIGTFILQEPKILSRPLYGHQGMAYGAVHGLFFDPESGKIAVLLTTGASEARRGVLADINFALLRHFFGGA